MASIATSSTCWQRSQSASASNAGVTAAYSRTSCTRRPGLVSWYPHTHHQPGLADVDRAHPCNQLRRLLGQLLHRTAYLSNNGQGRLPAGAVPGKTEADSRARSTMQGP